MMKIPGCNGQPELLTVRVAMGTYDKVESDSAWKEPPKENLNTILRGILSEFKKHNQLQREAVYLMKMKDTGVQIIPLKEMQEEE